MDKLRRQGWRGFFLLACLLWSLPAQAQTIFNPGSTTTSGTGTTNDLVIFTGASSIGNYAGTSCTNQVFRLLSAAGAATCVTLTSAYVDTSIWTGTVAANAIPKSSSQGVLAASLLTDDGTTLTYTGTGGLAIGTGYLISIAGSTLGELPAGASLTAQGAGSGIRLTPSANGTAGATLALGYYNGAAWYSALDVAHVAGGGTTRSTLNLMKSGGTVSMGAPIIFGTDNANDLGAAGATRPRTGYFGTSVVSPLLTNASADLSLSTTTSGNITFSPAGVVVVNGTAGPRLFNLQSGNTTAEFPYAVINTNTTVGARTGLAYAVQSTSWLGTTVMAGIEAIVIGANGQTDMTFWTNQGSSISERMRLSNSGALGIGKTAAAGIKLDVNGQTNATLYGTATNCSSSAAPAVCSAAPAGSVVIAAAGTAVTVNTTAVTANSQILIQEDSSLGTKLSVTCNTTIARTYAVTARVAATSFTITTSAAPVTNPACLSYTIVN